MGNKTLIAFGIGVTLFIMVIGTFTILEVTAQAYEPEIDQNQVEDEISRTILVKLQDGITSSDDIN